VIFISNFGDFNTGFMTSNGGFGVAEFENVSFLLDKSAAT
jgi:hypothetical protein